MQIDPRVVLLVHLLEEALPHLLHVERLLFEGELHDGAHEAGLRARAMHAVLQPAVLLDVHHRVQQRLPLILRHGGLGGEKKIGLGNKEA